MKGHTYDEHETLNAAIVEARKIGGRVSIPDGYWSLGLLPDLLPTLTSGSQYWRDVLVRGPATLDPGRSA